MTGNHTHATKVEELVHFDLRAVLPAPFVELWFGAFGYLANCDKPDRGGREAIGRRVGQGFAEEDLLAQTVR